MAQASSSIFNKSATERLRSPDDLDKYLQVTNPSVWVVLAACLSLLVGLLAWGIFGTVATNISAIGVVLDDQVVCFLPVEEAARVSVGDDVNVNGVNMELVEVSAMPLSRNEASQLLGNDYVTAMVFTDDWECLVAMDGDVSEFPEGMPLVVSITTERVAPISLMLGGK
jgi:hypothetical protein